MNKMDDILSENEDIDYVFDEIDRLNLSLELCFKNLILTQKHLNAAMSLLEKKGLLTNEEFEEELAKYDAVYEQELERLNILLNEQENVKVDLPAIQYFGPIGEA